MKIFNNLEDIKNTEPAVIALGNFDGIHRGHRQLIMRAVKSARARRVKSAVFTFRQHPRNVLAGHTVVRNIVYPDVKVELIRELGVDYLFSVPFDNYLMHQPPGEFVRDVLQEKFHAVGTVCGFNFTYGYQAGGGAFDLVNEGGRYGFEAIIVPTVTIGNEIVSSTLIRKYVAEGNMEKAGELLGRDYSIRGTVIHGNEIGRTIGFPTCNITVDSSMVTPSNGVYFTHCIVDGEEYPSITNVGNKPTIGTYDKNIETNILDFDGDIYGHTVEIVFMKKHRTERKFSGIDELRKQLDADKQKARIYHQSHRLPGVQSEKLRLGSLKANHIDMA